MNVIELSKEYEQSALAIKLRIEALQDQLKQKTYDIGEFTEQRLNLLTAEYYHLVRTSKYLKEYYNKDSVMMYV